METRRKVAVYARISQDRDQSGHGVARQLKDCRAEVARRGWTVFDEYVDDDISASGFGSKERPNYQRLLSDIENHLIDAVIVWHLDRLHRKPIELEQFVATCTLAGLNDVVTLHGDLDLGSGDGLFVARLMAAVAANESDAKSRRIKRKMQELAEAGESHGGNRCFGFEPDQITVRKPEAKIIRELAKRCLAGETLGSMVRWLNDSGIPTVLGLKEWKVSTVRRMLLHPRMYGMRIHQGQIIGESVSKPIFSKEIGERIHTILTDPSRTKNRAPRRYLVSGLCRCSKCGATLLAKPKDGVRRYVCVNDGQRSGCGGAAIGAETLEELIIRSVFLRLDSSSLIEAVDATQSDNGQESDLAENIKTDIARMEELATLWSDSAITSGEWKTARDHIDLRLQSNRRAVSKLRGNSDLTPLIGNGQMLRKQWETLNLSRQVAIVKILVDHVLILPAPTRGPKQQILERVKIVWRL